ncbi:MAG: CRISPR-associated helicase/endonuclease Cas3 [Syntrophaceae bacterium]|nr:CRISPR-associated helicase/endonuclease Cas3 [Syntrophaceae bacterium]
MSIQPAYYRYWGKADREGASYHLLPYHCLDVAAVIATWWDASATIRRSFCQYSAVTETQIRAWLLMFTALHDYGKYDIRFQLKVKPAWKALYPLSDESRRLPSEYECREYMHGENGLSWFKQDFFRCFGCSQSNSMFVDEDDPAHWLQWKPWIEATTGHHGHVKDVSYIRETALSSLSDQGPAELDRTVRISWLETLCQFFLQPVGLSLNDSPPPPSPLLAGLCSVADWLASRCDEVNFTFQNQKEPLSSYFERKLSDDAPRIFSFSGINGSPKDYGGIQQLLPVCTSPHPLQTMVNDLPLHSALTIIEAPTGSGKTEAALAYAWRLLAADLVDSIIFALPTQATANAMLGRLETVATKLFNNSPNLLLAHGSARFNDKFAGLKRKGIYADGEPDGWVQCGQWLAESRKRVFLGQIGICTIDQVLISVLPVKHRFVRSFGIGRSILIVDEVHAYDAYMYGLLEEVLRQQHAAGASVILMSATLPANQKRQLCATWQTGSRNMTGQAPYPLITWVGENESGQLSLTQQDQPKSQEVKAECLRTDKMEPDDSILQRAVMAADEGAQVAIICNLVATAQGVARRLKNFSSAPVDLFHARYRFKDRQTKENNIIQQFGPKGNRDQGRILVATQVVEQSLDLDFDWIVTQLCPVDLLFQRMGRLHRHEHSKRPPNFEKPVCTVLLPRDSDYGLTGKVYSNTRVLWRTEQLLINTTDEKVMFPSAYRNWIEPVYQETAWEKEPNEITKAYEQFANDLFVSRSKARVMIHSAANPFGDTDEVVAAVTRDGEMNLTVIPYLESPDGKRLLDGELIDDLDDYRQAEELALNSVSVPHGWRGWLKNACREVDDKGCWLAMTEKGGNFVSEWNNIVFRYHRDTGLEMER